MNEIPNNDAAPMTAPEAPSATATVEGLSAVACSALVDALSEVLSHHALACVSRLNLHDKPWSFDVASNGSPLITPESCTCSASTKYLRGILPANHPKGFSQNTEIAHP